MVNTMIYFLVKRIKELIKCADVFRNKIPVVYLYGMNLINYLRHFFEKCFFQKQ